MTELKPLRPLEWIDLTDKDFVANFQVRVVEINGIRCKIFTVGDKQPGTFGLRMPLGKTSRVLAQNNLPYRDCVCDAGTESSPLTRAAVATTAPDSTAKEDEDAAADLPLSSSSSVRSIHGSHASKKHKKQKDDPSILSKPKAASTKTARKQRSSSSSSCSSSSSSSSSRVSSSPPEKKIGKITGESKSSHSSSFEDENGDHTLTHSSGAAAAAAPMEQLMEENPCWVNLHFHGFWGPAKQDDVYACLKPGQQKQYCYTFNKCHPTGLYIIHTHNFTAGVFQETISTFPVEVYDPCGDGRGGTEKHTEKRHEDTLFLCVGYLQRASEGTSLPRGYELEVFDFPKYLGTPEFGNLLRAAPKVVLTNGDVSPVKSYPIGERIILKIAWTGIADILSLAILDDFDEPIEYEIISFDSITVPVPIKTRGFSFAHMQRFDIAFTLPKHKQYRLVKYLTQNEQGSIFSTGASVLLFLNTFPEKCAKAVDKHRSADEEGKESKDWKESKESKHSTDHFSGKVEDELSLDSTSSSSSSIFTRAKDVTTIAAAKDGCCTEGSSGPIVPIPPPCRKAKEEDDDDKHDDAFAHFSGKVSVGCWADRVNRKFRNLKNVAAWRTFRFQHPVFPDIEGAMFDATGPPQITMTANHSEVWLVSSSSGTHSIHTHLFWFLVLAQRTLPTTAADSATTGKESKDSKKGKKSKESKVGGDDAFADFSRKVPWEVIPREAQWFQDTLLLFPQQQYLIWAFPFADKKVKPQLQATGKVMMHCHQTEHADLGMMLTMLVQPPNAPNPPSGVGLVDGPQSKEILRIVKESSFKKKKPHH